MQIKTLYIVILVWRRVYADEYAKANYYYGRLLRAKDHYPEAMQCFIHAIHSRSKDYHILGRVYSNMGTISHLAGEYDLSYEMYEHSADMFLRNGDTINYYYALYNMAFELAEQEKREETLKILKIIQENASDSYAIALSCITKADLYLNIEEYDSAIYYIDIVQRMQYQIPTAYLIKAQSYEALGKLDSALHYANCVLAMPNLANEQIYNSLYITINYNPPASKEELLRQTSYRADIGMKGDYQHVQEAKAVEILYQDLHKPYDWRWLYAVIATLMITVCAVLIFVRIKKNQHKLLSQQIQDLETTNKVAVERQREIKKEREEYSQKIISSMEQKRMLFSQSPSILTDISWSDYSSMCTMINNNFGLLASKLQKKYQLSEKEVRLCVLVLFDFSYEQMSELLYYSYKGIGKYKDRIAKKIGTSSKKLCEYLIEEAAGEH